VTVVTKYLFQFGFFPWNSHAVLQRHENKPYFPPRILGLEKRDGYVRGDLAQLMALFFHRSQLLCYGLWDHEDDPLSKEHDRGSRKKGAEEELAPLGPQEEPGVARTEGDIQLEVRDGPPEPQDKRRISLRFRRSRRESTEPRGQAAVGTRAPLLPPDPGHLVTLCWSIK
ncbi:hypothetical protein CB1_097912001, partial [Camelus ferus]